MALWALGAATVILALGVKETATASENATSAALNCLFGQETIDSGITFSNGSLMTSEGVVYPNGTWESAGDQFYVCKCIARPCFRKCCPEGQVVNSTNMKCFDLPEDWDFMVNLRPEVFREVGLQNVIEANEPELFDERFEILHGFPCSKPWILPELEEVDQFYLLDDGKLAAWRGEDMLDVSQFCYTVVLDEEMIFPLICHREMDSESSPVRYILYAIGMFISTPFLGATFVIYALLSHLHNTHGRCIMSHVLVLFIAYISLGIVGVHQEISDRACMAFAFIIYFAFLASFFWLNVMCLDIWWTFSGFRPMRGSVKEREHKKFIIYSLYCWGSPLIMLIICMVMDLHPDIPDSYIKPGFGELKCWFKSNLGNLIYFSGPIAILIVCNIILFILTAVKIQQVKRGTKILKKQDSRRHNEEEENNAQRFNLYFKLFLVMGVNWIMEIVSFAAGGPDEYWYITDIANTLQGVLIFIIFVWKDRIRKLLMERFCPGRAANTNSLNNSSSTRTTGIRHNGSVMSSHRPSFKNKDDYQMKTLTSPSARSDDSDVA